MDFFDKKTTDRLIKQRMDEARELLAEFGLQLHGMDPGITAYFTDPRQPRRGGGYFGEPFAIGRNEWMWLRPLLLELRDRRLAMNGDKDAAERIEFGEILKRKREEIQRSLGPEGIAVLWTPLPTTTTKSGSPASPKPTRRDRSVRKGSNAAGHANARSGARRRPSK